MKLLSYCKDGGPESTVWSYTIVEIKWLFSIVLLRFENGSRDAYHDHAFDAVSWLLSGYLVEDRIVFDDHGSTHAVYARAPHPAPIITRRSHLHRVVSVGRSWVLSIRGPWKKTWHEYVPPVAPAHPGTVTTLTHGRRPVEAGQS